MKNSLKGGAIVAKRKPIPAKTPEEKVQQLIALSYDEAERRILDGTATSEMLCLFIKMGSMKEKQEEEIRSQQVELLKAKTDSIKSAKELSMQYAEAIKVMQIYNGEDDE